MLFRDAPLDIWGWGGGGARVFVACKLFFTCERKQSFLWRSTSDYFFLCFVKEIFCRMLSLLCTLPFSVFSGQHIFHQFRQQTSFFLPTFSTNFFFLTFLATTPPPPPDIKWCAPYRLQKFKQNGRRAGRLLRPRNIEKAFYFPCSDADQQTRNVSPLLG